MDEKNLPLTNPVPQPAEESLLSDLAALTGLFNPEEIWRKEEKLDELEQADEPLNNQQEAQ